MPITARLSRKFYETFGEDLTNELVDWFNAVDTSYRADLREFNELNFSRFDAKLEQRLAESDARWTTRIAELDTKWFGHWTQLDAKIDRRLAELESKLIRWMFAFWAPTTIAIFTLLLRG